MAVLAKPSDQAIVLPMRDKDTFVERSRRADSFQRMMERRSHVTAKVSYSGVGSEDGADRK